MLKFNKISYKDSTGAVYEAGLSTTLPNVIVASETSSDKAKAAADFVIPNDSNILKAINIAFESIPSTGGEIHFCVGDYIIPSTAPTYYGEVFVKSNTIVSGEGTATKFTLERSPTWEYSLFMLDGSNITVRDMHFIQKGKNYAIDTFNNLSNITIKDLKLGGGYDNACSICINESQDINIDSCYLDATYDFVTGVRLTRCKNINIHDSFFQLLNDGFGICGTRNQYVNIYNNTFKSRSDYSVAISISGDSIYVHDNIYIGQKDGSYETFANVNGGSYNRSFIYNNHIYMNHPGSDTNNTTITGSTYILNMNNTSENWNREWPIVYDNPYA